MNRLSEAQWRVLRRIRSTARAFDGRSMRTLDSLCRLGYVSYYSRWECKSCGKYDCPKHKSGRWRSWAELTPAGEALLRGAS